LLRIFDQRLKASKKYKEVFDQGLKAQEPRLIEIGNRELFAE
jgi:hypothetical protein